MAGPMDETETLAQPESAAPAPSPAPPAPPGWLSAHTHIGWEDGGLAFRVMLAEGELQTPMGAVEIDGRLRVRVPSPLGRLTVEVDASAQNG